MQILLDRVSEVIGGTILAAWTFGSMIGVLYWAAQVQVGEMTLSFVVPLFGATSVIADLLSYQIL